MIKTWHWLLLGCLLSFSSSAFAAEENTASPLPAGYYLYLGPQPGKVDGARGFHIDAGGKVYWDASADKSAVSQTSEPQSEKPKVDDSIGPQYDNCDTVDYPVLQWKPRPVGDLPGGVAKLWTTLDTSSFMPKLRFKLTLFKVPQDAASFREIQLLDANGFQVKKLTASDFVPIQGTDLLEARGDQLCPGSDYQRIRDYVVK